MLLLLLLLPSQGHVLYAYQKLAAFCTAWRVACDMMSNLHWMG
jgi:hypothetical protein